VHMSNSSLQINKLVSEMYNEMYNEIPRNKCTPNGLKAHGT